MGSGAVISEVQAQLDVSVVRRVGLRIGQNLRQRNEAQLTRVRGPMTTEVEM